MDKEELRISKLCAYREKDLNFVAALVAADLVSPELIIERLPTVPHEHAAAVKQALTWLTSAR